MRYLRLLSSGTLPLALVAGLVMGLVHIAYAVSDERMREIVAEELGENSGIHVDFDRIPKDATEEEIRASLASAKAMRDAMGRSFGAARGFPEGAMKVPVATTSAPILDAGDIERIFAEEADGTPGLSPEQFFISPATTEERLRAKIRAGKTLKALSLKEDEAKARGEVFTPTPEEERMAAEAMDMLMEDISVAMGYAMGEALGSAVGQVAGKVGQSAERTAAAIAREAAAEKAMAQAKVAKKPVTADTPEPTAKMEEVEAIGPGHPDATVKAGLSAYYQGRLRTAEARLEAAAVAHPGAPDARYYLGYTRYKMGEFAKARADFAEAYRIDPDFSPIPLPEPNWKSGQATVIK
ncbi:MAG: tetratricopeptide repeat protein [Leptospirillia bacterium]